MIRYTLKCDNGHRFDSWFQSAKAFDALEKSGHLACSVCGSAEISKTIMSPRVATSAPEKPTAQPMITEPSNEVEQAIDALRRKVEETADYVGADFANEARAIHLDEAPGRPIYGEARLDQARALIEEGVPVAPLPFRPKQKLS